MCYAQVLEKKGQTVTKYQLNVNYPSATIKGKNHMENESITQEISAKSTDNVTSQKAESYFDGGVLQRFGWKILGHIVTAATLGICYPFAVCWLYEWEAKHTVIDGRRLKFTGSPAGLFGTWILCLVLTIVTVGIYGFYVPIKIRRWREANTFFEDELTAYDSAQKLKFEKASYFDGGFWQFFGWQLLGDVITFFTAGICYPWAVQMIYSWEQRHKVYCKKRCVFDGTAVGLFGTWILCLFLSIITLGIYSLWIPIRIKKWQISHTHLVDNLSSEEKEKSKEKIEKKCIEIDKKKASKIACIAAAAFAAIGIFSLCVNKFSSSVPANKAVDYIYSLSNDAAVKIKGKLSDEELSYIFEAISAGNYKVDLDLSKTTGLKEVYVSGSDSISCFVENLRSIKFSKYNKIIHSPDYWGTDLQEVEFPEGVEEISGFGVCENIKSIFIPASVSEFHGFTGCTSLERIEVAGGNPVYSGSGNCILKKDSGELVLACKNTVIPKNVKKIGSSAFKGIKELTSIEIPDSVSEIGFKAFSGCTGLTNIEIPDTVTKIGFGAFSDCTGLTSVTINNGITTIEEKAFYNCSGLKEIKIPDSVTVIERNAFSKCKELLNVTIPNNVTEIGTGAFADCEELKSCVFEDPQNWNFSYSIMLQRGSFGNNDYASGDVKIPASKLSDPYYAADILRYSSKLLAGTKDEDLLHFYYASFYSYDVYYVFEKAI